MPNTSIRAAESSSSYGLEDLDYETTANAEDDILESMGMPRLHGTSALCPYCEEDEHREEDCPHKRAFHPDFA